MIANPMKDRLVHLAGVVDFIFARVPILGTRCDSRANGRCSLAASLPSGLSGGQSCGYIYLLYSMTLVEVSA